MKCDRCNWDYPPEILAPFISTKKQVAHCCGICALELKNEIHELNERKFGSPMAEKRRQDALNWRASHAVAE